MSGIPSGVLTLTRRLPGLALITGVALLSGCASIGGWLGGPDAATLENDMVERVRDDRSAYYGVGVGADRPEAEQEARRDLAQQLMGNLRVERRSEQRVAEDTEQSITVRHKEQYRASVDSLVQVELEQVRRVSSQPGSDGNWVAKVALERDLAQELIDRSRERLPALEVAENLLAVPETLPGRRLRYALIGRYHTERQGVEAESFYHRDIGLTTMEGVFSEQIRRAVEAMRVLPVVTDDGVHFVLIDRESYTPQAGVLLEVDGERLSTDDRGRTSSIPRDDLAERASVTVLGFDPDDEEGNWLHPDSARHLQLSELSPNEWGQDDPRLLVHTSPAGALVSVDRDEGSSPMRMRVSGGESYRVQAELDDHETARTSVEVHDETPYAYTSLALDELRYGHLDLTAPAGDAVVRLQTRTGTVVDESSDRIQEEVEVGSYTVEVIGDPEDEDAYENIRERGLRVSEGSETVREYRAPRRRIWEHRGWLFSVRAFRLGGEPLQGFRLPWVNGERDYTQLSEVESVTGVDHEPLGIDWGLGVQYLANTLNLTVRGDLTRVENEFSLDQSGHEEGSVDLEAISRRASLGAGFWSGFMEDRLLMSLTANRAVEHTRWDSDSRAEVLVDEEADQWERLPSSGETNQFNFLDLSVGYSELSDEFPNLGVQFSVVVPEDTLKPFVSLGVSLQLMERGYTGERSSSVRARSGTHY